MNTILTLVAGAIAGFCTYSITMKVSFKQRTIDNKIRVYDSIIVQWVKLRNFIYANKPNSMDEKIPREKFQQFDQIYGESQQFIGEAFLVSENEELANDVNELNERMFRANWHELNLDAINKNMEEIKKDALSIIPRMREDIKASTRFEWKDFLHVFRGKIT